MDAVFDKVKKAASDVANKISTGNKQTEGLGAELAARAQMNRAGEQAVKGDSKEEPKPAAPESPTPVDKVPKHPPIKGEKRIPDEKLKEYMKPLGSYAKGTDSVPKTGVYKVHKGEAVVDKDTNMAEHSPEEKAHFARSMHKLHGGALHRHFGIPEDQPIPMEKKQEAANSDNPHVAAMGRMAVAMHGWHHPKKA